MSISLKKFLCVILFSYNVRNKKSSILQIKKHILALIECRITFFYFNEI